MPSHCMKHEEIVSCHIVTTFLTCGTLPVSLVKESFPVHDDGVTVVTLVVWNTVVADIFVF